MKLNTLLFGLLVCLTGLCAAQTANATPNKTVTKPEDCKNKTLTECKVLADGYFDAEKYQGALSLYSDLCESEQATSCHRVAWMYQTQTGVVQDMDAAVEYYQKSCGLDYGQSCQNLAVIYEFWLETDTPVTKIVELYKKGCDLKIADACANLAINYSQGDGVEQDSDKYLLLTQKSCALGNDSACTDIGDHYDDVGDMVKSLQFHLKACELNSAYGCQQSAWKYAKDLGEKVDLTKAHNLNAKACDLENATACNNLGRAYIGYSESRDPKIELDKPKGLKLLMRACYDYEFSSACADAGYAYDGGDDAVEDQALGHKLFIRSCDELEEPDSYGCSFLGHSYEYGNDVVKRNKEKSQHYYKKSCSLGHEDSCEKLRPAT